MNGINQINTELVWVTSMDIKKLKTILKKILPFSNNIYIVF